MSRSRVFRPPACRNSFVHGILYIHTNHGAQTLGHEFINPNWHVILIHLPLGIFVLGVLIEAFSFLYRDAGIRVVARGMMWLGALGAIPAAMSGVYALADVTMASPPSGQPWVDVATAASGPGGLGDAQWEFIGRHAWAQTISTIVAALLVTIGMGLSDHWRQRLQIPLMIGLIAALVGMTWGAYFGGEMVYRHGVAVTNRHEHNLTTQATAGIAAPTTDVSTDDPNETKSGVSRYVAPMQLHVTLAGFSIAIALAALGMSMRVLSTADQWRDPEVAPARNLLDLESSGSRRPDHEAAVNHDADYGAGPVGIPSARFWLLTTLLAAATAAAGWWVLASSDEIRSWNPKTLWTVVSGQKRLLFHSFAAGAIVILPLILALSARFARRSKVLLGFFSLVLLIVVAAQVWLGVLLMFDSSKGPVNHFNVSARTGVVVGS